MYDELTASLLLSMCGLSALLFIAFMIDECLHFNVTRRLGARRGKVIRVDGARVQARAPALTRSDGAAHHGDALPRAACAGE